MTDDQAVTIILNRLDGLDRKVDDFRKSSEESRGRLHDKVNATNIQIAGLTARVEIAEKAITGMSPTISEFLTYKEQVRGAGKLGRGLWWLGGVILAGAASLSAFITWLLSTFTWK